MKKIEEYIKEHIVYDKYNYDVDLIDKITIEEFDDYYRYKVTFKSPENIDKLDFHADIMVDCGGKLLKNEIKVRL